MAETPLVFEVDGAEINASSAFSLILKLNRGSLTYPTGFSVARYCYFVYSILASDPKSEALLLNALVQQSEALKEPTKKTLLNQCNFIAATTCNECGISLEGLARHLVAVCSNALLNGFWRKKTTNCEMEKKALAWLGNKKSLLGNQKRFPIASFVVI